MSRKDDVENKVGLIIHKINTLTGRQFEFYTAYLFKLLGYHHIKVTRASGDFGIDVIAVKDGKTYGIQCKHFSSNNEVGYRAVEETVCGCKFYGLNKGIILTNSKYTPNTKIGARKCHIKLLNHKWLKNTLNKLVISKGTYLHYKNFKQYVRHDVSNYNVKANYRTISKMYNISHSGNILNVNKKLTFRLGNRIKKYNKLNKILYCKLNDVHKNIKQSNMYYRMSLVNETFNSILRLSPNFKSTDINDLFLNAPYSVSSNKLIGDFMTLKHKYTKSYQAFMLFIKKMIEMYRSYKYTNRDCINFYKSCTKMREYGFNNYFKETPSMIISHLRKISIRLYLLKAYYTTNMTMSEIRSKYINPNKIYNWYLYDIHDLKDNVFLITLYDVYYHPVIYIYTNESRKEYQTYIYNIKRTNQIADNIEHFISNDTPLLTYTSVNIPLLTYKFYNVPNFVPSINIRRDIKNTKRINARNNKYKKYKRLINYNKLILINIPRTKARKILNLTPTGKTYLKIIYMCRQKELSYNIILKNGTKRDILDTNYINNIIFKLGKIFMEKHTPINLMYATPKVSSIVNYLLWNPVLIHLYNQYYQTNYRLGELSKRKNTKWTTHQKLTASSIRDLRGGHKYYHSNYGLSTIRNMYCINKDTYVINGIHNIQKHPILKDNIPDYHYLYGNANYRYVYYLICSPKFIHLYNYHYHTHKKIGEIRRVSNN